MVRKLLSLCLALALALTLLPATAGAVDVSTWSRLRDRLITGGSVRLTDNIISGPDDPYLVVPMGSEATLDLNGFTIDRHRTSADENGYVIYVNGLLTITDSSEAGTGKITGGWNSEENCGCLYIVYGDVTMNGGTITGNQAQKGSGVYIIAGNFTMNGGEIRGNSGYAGGGVYLHSGTFRMSGGVITQNKATYGGGVCADGGSFMLDGGEIRGNTATYGGGIQMGQVSGKDPGVMTMNGGMISGNYASYGGGIHAERGRLTMYRGTITDNATSQTGGGIRVTSSVEVQISDSPVVIGNTVGARLVNGAPVGGRPGNVYLENGKYIVVAGDLEREALLGITTQTAPTEASRIDITFNLAERGVLANFVNDDPAYSIVWSAGRSEAQLALIPNSSSEWTNLQNNLDAGGTIRLSADVSALANDASLVVPAGVEATLDLAGYTVDRNRRDGAAYDYVIDIQGKLTLCDSVGGGKLTGGHATYGGGVLVEGDFIMESGEISGNFATYDGGGMYIKEEGSFVMNDGRICGNVAGINGAGVYLRNTFVMNGGEISGNESRHNSLYPNLYGNGGVAVASGTFTMRGGSIRDNIGAAEGGGVGVESGTFIMEGGDIIGNQADLGAGVMVHSNDRSEIILSGNIVIVANLITSGSMEQNVYLCEDECITISDPIGSFSEIGVTLEYPPAENVKSVTFTSGLTSGGRIDVFRSDDPEYRIKWNADGSEAVLALLAAEYIVSYDANGGENAPAAQTKIEDEPLTLASQKPTRTGYLFLGWSESASAQTAQYQPGDSFTKNEDTTLYAVWKLDESWDGPKVIVSSASAKPGETVTLTVSLSKPVSVKALMLSRFRYDHEALTLINARWNISGTMISDWSAADESGVAAFAANTRVEGTIFTMTFSVSEEVEGDFEISLTPVLKAKDGNGPETTIDVLPVPGMIRAAWHTRGDLDDNGYVDSDDAIYLLRHTMMPDRYPINQSGDMNGDGSVDSDDAIYLLRNTLRPDKFPLH